MVYIFSLTLLPPLPSECAAEIYVRLHASHSARVYVILFIKHNISASVWHSYARVNATRHFIRPNTLGPRWLVWAGWHMDTRPSNERILCRHVQSSMLVQNSETTNPFRPEIGKSELESAQKHFLQQWGTRVVCGGRCVFGSHSRYRRAQSRQARIVWSMFSWIVA